MTGKLSVYENQIRHAAEQDLLTFIKLVAPQRVMGAVHEELIHWWQRDDAHSHQLVLLPRGHQKSSMIAYRVAHEITRNPSVTILYLSATSNLAEKQLKMIKDILTSSTYRKYWPEMVNSLVSRRERWTSREIAVDHPDRKQEGVRDPTVFTAGLESNLVGMHCDIMVMDDVVTQDNAYTEQGRSDVTGAYSLLSSIENPEAREWAVGTRYHPKDLWNDLMHMEEEIFDDEGTIIDRRSVYEVFERKVEDRGDGAGEFLWPKQRRHDGKWFGFDAAILAKKRAQYLDKAKYRAQYYNDPNDPDNVRIETFQYYDKKFLDRKDGRWYYRDKPLNLFAAIDFAFSLRKAADYTTVVVVGVDPDGMIYILDIDRFKTDRISDYFKHIQQMYIKWGFRKLRAEVTVAQSAVVKELKEQYLRPQGLALAIEEHRPNRHQGTKEERIAATLEPRYENSAVWHYKGGNCQILEEELILAYPPHDDIKDALANAIEIAVAPVDVGRRRSRDEKVIYHPRFGGAA